MIRRGFWLAVGAALGIASYRKASRMAQALTGTARQPAARSLGRATAGPRALGARTRRGQTSGFIGDVRNGMAEYWDLHRRDLDRNLELRDGRTSPGAESRDSRPGLREF
jgi:hypothetical protein